MEGTASLVWGGALASPDRAKRGLGYMGIAGRGANRDLEYLSVAVWEYWAAAKQGPALQASASRRREFTDIVVVVSRFLAKETKVLASSARARSGSVFMVKLPVSRMALLECGVTTRVLALG